MSGVPQGSVLFLIYIYIYINDLEDDISSKVLKFAHDKYSERLPIMQINSLQDDLDKLNGQKNGKCYS